MRAWRAAAIACALVAACGGRSTLETDEGPTASAGSPSPSEPGQAGSSSGKPDPSKPDPSKPDPSAPTVGGTTAAAGGSTPAPGGSTPAPGNPDPDPASVPGPKPDVNCSSDHAKGGMACSMPCLTTCGFYDLGTKDCDCVSGVFVSCRCPRPWEYQGSPAAPTCDTSDGRTHWIDNTPCSNEWAQCIGTDPVSGTNPRGCVCLTDPVNGKLEWTCGSTNRWFLHE